MAVVIRYFSDIYFKLITEYDDPRARDFPLMSNPFKPIALIGLYLLFVLRWGPSLMEGRKPLKLHNFIKCYNLFQVAFCAFIMCKGFYHSFGQGYSWFCEPIDYSDSYHPTEMVKIGYLYYVSKIIDLLDTVFFVLRKKQSHVSFLHVYHHAGMVALGWIGAKYLSGGQSVFMGLINSFVHVIMYFYYYLTSVDNKFKTSVWKKYITQLQMIQFGLMALHWISLLISKPCGYPKMICGFMIPQNLFIFFLFFDFYLKTYRKKPEALTKETNSSDENANVIKGDHEKLK